MTDAGDLAEALVSWMARLEPVCGQGLRACLRLVEPRGENGGKWMLKSQYPNWPSALNDAKYMLSRDISHFNLFINFVLWRAGEPSLFQEHAETIVGLMPNWEKDSPDPLAWLKSWEHHTR